MLNLLTLFGYTEYQAECLAPWLWFFFLAGVFVGFAGLIGAILNEKGDEASDEAS